MKRIAATRVNLNGLKVMDKNKENIISDEMKKLMEEIEKYTDLPTLDNQ